MAEGETLRLSIEEARGLMLAAQGLLDPPPQSPAPGLDDVRAMVERLGVLQIDTISVVERAQYLALWSRLGPYDRDLLDRLLYPERAVFEYWGHAASIAPMADYRYYRPKMLRYHEHMWAGNRQWLEENPTAPRDTLAAIRERGPLASSDFERPPDKARTGPWDWFGPKDSRRALEILWTMGDLMIHSRRAGQKVYDVRERVLAEAFGAEVPRDDELPTPEDVTRYFARHTVQALGVVTPSWLWDYFRLSPSSEEAKSKRVAALAMLNRLREEGVVAQAAVEGLTEPAFVARAALPVLARLRGGVEPERTTLLSPFDSLIWDRARAQVLFGWSAAWTPRWTARRGACSCARSTWSRGSRPATRCSTAWPARSRASPASSAPTRLLWSARTRIFWRPRSRTACACRRRRKMSDKGAKITSRASTVAKAFGETLMSRRACRYAPRLQCVLRYESAVLRQRPGERSCPLFSLVSRVGATERSGSRASRRRLALLLRALAVGLNDQLGLAQSQAHTVHRLLEDIHGDERP